MNELFIKGMGVHQTDGAMQHEAGMIGSPNDQMTR
jgi:hypothetical protein